MNDEYPEKNLGAEMGTNNKLNPHMTPRPGIEPGPHWWVASALTTAPSTIFSHERMMQRVKCFARVCW